MDRLSSCRCALDHVVALLVKNVQLLTPPLVCEVLPARFWRHDFHRARSRAPRFTFLSAASLGDLHKAFPAPLSGCCSVV
eukprot:6178583-Amphidinium_carterae.4